MEINIAKEVKTYLQNWRDNLKIVGLFVCIAIAISIISTPKYTTEFSLYQKSPQLGFLSSLTENSDTASLDSIVNSKQLLIHLASKKWGDKSLWEVLNIDQSIKNKIIDNLFRRNTNHENLYFDRSITKLKESIIDMRYSLENNNVNINITYKDKVFAESLANEIILFINEYYANINNQVAAERNEYIKLRIDSMKDDIDNTRDRIILLKEKNIALSSPKLIAELQELETDLVLKTTLYSQLFSQYEIKILESIDKSDTVFLITEPYTAELPTSPDFKFNILLSIIIGLVLTFFFSVRKNNDQFFV